MIYQWKSGARVNADAQTIGERLSALREEEGQLTASVVVDDARPERSVMHPCFEWDDDIAAEKYREHQARHILNSITVIVEQPSQEPREIRAFAVVTQDGENSYEPIVRVMQEPELRQQVLMRARQELDSFRKKYREYQELAEVIGAIDRVLVAAS